MKQRYLFYGAWLLPMFALANNAATHLQPDHNMAKELVKSGEIKSLDTLLANLALFCDGQLVDAHLYQLNQQWRYDLLIKVDQGKVLKLDLNAATAEYDGHSPLPQECRPHETATR